MNAVWFVFVASLLTLLTSCVVIPLSSNMAVNDKLQSLEPLQPGDVLVVYGDNAPPRPQPGLTDYFSLNCLQARGNRDAIAYLIAMIKGVNPQRGMFSVKHLFVSKVMENDPDCSEDSILCRLGLTKAQVLSDHLRYAIYVKEDFEAKLHVPLYAYPAGIASCSHKTVLEADVWELSTDKHIGSLTVSAEGELTVVGYVFQFAVERDTQKDATKKLAREIVERFTGLKPLEVDEHVFVSH